ncbi:MAG: hypothetical protein KDA45_13230, partial [Planctomycetales bacterium]|nr:hypothetical protein [Planctomycetales bacterium]
QTGDSSVAEPEAPNTKWVDAEGREAEADFVRLTADSVILRLKANDREVAVPLASLSLESHFQAVKAAYPENFSKPVPKAETKLETAVDLPDLNLNVGEMLKSPFPSNPSIEQFLDIQKREYAAGNFFVRWHTLPPKMQADMEEVIAQTVAVLGPGKLKQIQTLLTDLNTVVSDKKEFIFASPLLAGNTQLEQHWPLISGLVAALSTDELWWADNFQRGKVAPWLATVTATLAPHWVALQEAVGDSPAAGVPQFGLEDLSYNIVSQSADSAEVELRGGQLPPRKVRYQKLGNIWIDPVQMGAMRKSLDDFKEGLAKGAGPQLTLLRTSLPGLIATVGGLARATTQEEFNLVVADLKLVSQGVADAAKAAGLGGSPGAVGPGGSGRGPRN